MRVRILFLLLVSFFLTLPDVYESESHAVLISDAHPPQGLSPFDPFRVIFVTSGVRDAMSSDIVEYDNFVQGFAPPGLSTTWQAVVSTSTISARDHTNTIPGTDGTGIPIFNMQGEILADNYADLWDGNLANPPIYDQNGLSVGFVDVWTGTDTSGDAIRSPFALGDSTPVRGAAWRSASLWIDTGIAANTNTLRIYGISDVIAGTPEPSTLALGLTGGLAWLALGWWRTRWSSRG